MKKILNYGITFIDDGKENDLPIFSKLTLIEKYIELLRTDRNISSLKCYCWEGIRKPIFKDITGEINRFLAY